MLKKRQKSTLQQMAMLPQMRMRMQMLGQIPLSMPIPRKLPLPRKLSLTQPLPLPLNKPSMTDVPHFSQAIWPPTSGDLDLVVDAGGDVEQVQDLLLQVAELWLEGLDDVVLCVDELVACEVVEDLQDPWRTRCWAVA